MQTKMSPLTKVTRASTTYRSCCYLVVIVDIANDILLVVLLLACCCVTIANLLSDSYTVFIQARLKIHVLVRGRDSIQLWSCTRNEDQRHTRSPQENAMEPQKNRAENTATHKKTTASTTKCAALDAAPALGKLSMAYTQQVVHPRQD